MLKCSGRAGRGGLGGLNKTATNETNSCDKCVIRQLFFVDILRLAFGSSAT